MIEAFKKLFKKKVHLYIFDREQQPTKNGMYDCLIYDSEGGNYLYHERIEFKDGNWLDYGEVIGWRE